MTIEPREFRRESHEMNPKITLIGAGSVVFAKRLIADVLQFPELSDARICLMDIDEERLRVAELVARKMIAKLGSRVTVEATLNQREAVRGANYVICTIQVGGYKPGTVIDFEIPKKYGLRQTIADTLGVGGIFRALRTIPVINQIARDIADFGAPDCLFLNYTNPMAMNCWAVDRAVGIPHVGLCHSIQGTSQQLASFCGLPMKDISYLVAGINHMAFFLKFEYQKQDAYPLLFKLLENPEFKEEKVRFEMMRRLGFFVTESSEHQSEYTPYFIHHGSELIEKFDIPLDEYIRRCELITASWQNEEKLITGGEGADIDIPARSHEYGAYIIRAREANVPTVIYGNVPNRGLITNLPEGCCVELPCLVDGQGLQPTRIGDLPAQLAGICRTNINPQEMTVEAALTGKREHIYHAAMLDPHTAAQLPLDKIWSLCDELIAAHQKVGLLSEYQPVIRHTGKSFAGTGDRVIATLRPASTLVPATAEEIRMEVEIENPDSVDHAVSLRVVASVDGITTETVAAVVPAGTTVRHPVKVGGGALSASQVEFHLLSDDRNVLGLGTLMASRDEVVLTTGTLARLPLTLAGFPAGEIRLKKKSTGIQVGVTVIDSHVVTAGPGEQLMDRSCVELSFADDVPGVKALNIYCLPNPESDQPTVTLGDFHAVPVEQATQKLEAGSYEIEVLLPWSALARTTAPSAVLFHAAVTIAALGDAHSGGKTSLSGKFGVDYDVSHFSLLTLQ